MNSDKEAANLELAWDDGFHAGIEAEKARRGDGEAEVRASDVYSGLFFGFILGAAVAWGCSK